MKYREEIRNEKKYKGLITTCTNVMVDMCHGLATEAGWHDQPREVGTMLMLVVSEISEAMEGFRKNLNDDHLPSRKMVEVELADAVIRIMDLAGKLQLDLGGAMYEKLLYNVNREDHKPENRNKENGKKFYNHGNKKTSSKNGNAIGTRQRPRLCSTSKAGANG